MLTRFTFDRFRSRRSYILTVVTGINLIVIVSYDINPIFASSINTTVSASITGCLQSIPINNRYIYSREMRICWGTYIEFLCEDSSKTHIFYRFARERKSNGRATTYIHTHLIHIFTSFNYIYLRPSTSQPYMREYRYFFIRASQYQVSAVVTLSLLLLP